MAQTPSECKPVVDKCRRALDACDTALEEKNGALTLADLAITNCNHETALNKQRADDMREELGTWYRNPLIVGTLGVIAGFATFRLLTK